MDSPFSESPSPNPSPLPPSAGRKSGDEAGSTAEVRGGAPAKPKLLIVDDQSAVQGLLCMALRKDYQTIQAADGEEALALIDQHKPDLVITDVSMPNMDGVELIRSIKAKPETADTLIIVMSGFERPAVRAELQQLGIAAFVNKPFSVSEMCDVVAQVLKPNSGKS